MVGGGRRLIDHNTAITVFRSVFVAATYKIMRPDSAGFRKAADTLDGR